MSVVKSETGNSLRPHHGHHLKYGGDRRGALSREADGNVLQNSRIYKRTPLDGNLLRRSAAGHGRTDARCLIGAQTADDRRLRVLDCDDSTLQTWGFRRFGELWGCLRFRGVLGNSLFQISFYVLIL